MSFNRVFSMEAYLNVTVESTTSTTAILNIEFPVSIIFETAANVSSTLIREFVLSTEIIETSTALLTEMIRERLMSAMAIETATEVSVTLTHSHVDEIRFLGDFKPGDMLVIDTRKMTVTLNGQNVIHLLDGDFFEFALGNNLLTYSDGEGARNLLTRITHRDKFLY
ncbi:phage tail family protein [Paenibacillus alvei]|uniref:Phage tail family protein n=1 Tax=Paenibacillus alvei TaxID=44250 RepID=A0ABT4GVG3_PAEAL|nr:phage tail domain-containing protein [Paenibacillus alvei]MCY9760434.1 phage tail family protein [Paenibacillus alvei]MCY9767726.1 phage tail family protein [Paenibacillus alvei]